MANRNDRDDFHPSRRSHLREGELGGDYARDDWDQNFGGDYARDTDRRGLSGDYALDPRWGGTGAGGDFFGPPGFGRGSSHFGYGPGSYGDDRSDHVQPSRGFRGRGPKNYRRSDERITEDVNEQLTEDRYVDASDIEVSVANGEVTLGGSVATRSMKRRAEDIAMSCRGVVDVQNRLRVDQGWEDVKLGKASE